MVLFNIDSKAESDSKQNKTAIVKVFNKVFNEMRGYSASIPWLAQLEETLERNGDYDVFQGYFEEETGLTWKEGREELYYNFDETITALSKAADITEETANKWLENGEENYSISVDSFAQRINQYVEQKNSNYRLIFAADEVGQYISGNTQLMLNLQTVVEDLGKYTHGKVWVLVTSQQDIDSLREELSSTDFSKIQGRFNTRVSLSSANADEVIKIRLLDKKAEPYAKLSSNYEEHEVALKNKLEFEEAATMHFYKDKDDFSRVYPFIPYQFNLLQKVFTGIREHGSSGKHLSDGERNLLESIQQATIEYKNDDLNTLIPFHTFYESIDQALEHSVRSTIIKAEQNETLDTFDLSVLKLLFLIRYVDEMPGTLKNLSTLMISNVDEDMIDLSKKISESLHLLEKEFLIQRIGNKYLFLTNEEQDVNREIGNITIPTSETVNEAGRRMVDDVLQLRRYTYQPFENNSKVEYLLDLSQWIDDRSIHNASTPLGIHFLSVFSEYPEEPDVLSLSQRESKVIVQLPENEKFSDLEYLLQVNQYLRTQSTKTKTPAMQEIISRKASERKQVENVFMKKLEDAISKAKLYVNGSPVDASGTPLKRIQEGLRVLVHTNYPKIGYVQKNHLKDDIEKLMYSQDIELLDGDSAENAQATNEIERYLDMQKERNMMVTLYEIIERYEKEPYGWLELDIIASLIKLMKAEKVTFTLNSRKMSSQENDFYRQITRQNMQEKIIISKRKVLDSAIINKVRRLTKELFSISSIGEKEDDIAKTISEKFSGEQSKLERFNAYYDRGFLPDRDLVREALKEIDRLLAIKDPSEFLTYFAKNDDVFLELFEALEDVKDFFDTNKREVYVNAQKKKELYESDRNYLDNEEIDYIAEQIESILKMARPYKKMKELQEWVERFNFELGQELDKQTYPVQDAIEQDKRDIEKELSSLQGHPEYDRIQRAFQFKINHLEQSIHQAPTVKVLQSAEQESREIKLTLLRNISEAKQMIAKRQEEERKAQKEKEIKDQPEVEKTIPEPKQSLTEVEETQPKTEIKDEITSIINKTDILPRQLVELRTKEDIEDYLTTLKTTLETELDEVDVIKIL